MVLGLDMRFLGGKWQKKNGARNKGNGFSYFGCSGSSGRRTGLGWDVDRAFWMGLHPMLFANSRQTFSDTLGLGSGTETNGLQ